LASSLAANMLQQWLKRVYPATRGQEAQPATKLPLMKRRGRWPQGRAIAGRRMDHLGCSLDASDSCEKSGLDAGGFHIPRSCIISTCFSITSRLYS
jgi:hypothetical protein